MPGCRPIPSHRTSAIELHEIQVGTQQDEEQIHGVNPDVAHQNLLAPVDRGFGAWSFLIAAFLIAGLVWGFPNTYGVFLLKYMEDPYWSSQTHASTLLPLVGPIATGIIYCAAPVTYALTSRFPNYRRKSLWFGVPLMFGSLFGASYARTLLVLLLLQGVTYAIGAALLYASSIYYMSEWFVEKRGLANGVIAAGPALGGVVLPLVLPSLIDKYGSGKTLRFFAIIISAMLLLILPFVRGRLPETPVVGPARPRSSNLLWLKDKNFWAINVANIIQALAYFVPILWLPTYVSSINLSANDAALSLAMLNAASLVGRLGFGTLSDIINPWTLASTTLVLTSLSVFVLWGVLSFNLAGVMVYGIVYGCLTGGWTSLWAGFLRPIAKDDPHLTTTLLGYFSLFRGIGNILSTPISTALRSNATSELASTHPTTVGGAYKGQYEGVILYAGTCFAAAAIVVGSGWLMNGTAVRRRGAI
ncbi:hypothetical protein PHLGIDRAFT_103577 [Phlebiopsis gigantea 11061_1 CR5-6]|uniref:Major facilitator superfamily (MFS) profile domain-containing protein n=1 Tax=Phlebiopsis gigantea (strain 11061_1 CR5-6) TaxID=745531 RepID=A0A0C3S1G0_PHLG1|nr:hypothetical protein PHLGIDRAFT_103577 [Phlebiopsis gigantea 11061_1 CR5-6]